MTTILLNPGPVTLSKRVREAMLRSDLCHREPEFAELQSNIRRKLLAVYNLDPAKWAAVLLTGSGTAAVEAMITSLVPIGGTLATLENGVYGERISRIAAAHSITNHAIAHGRAEAVDLSRVSSALGNGIAQLAVVHHETTVGRLNPMVAIAGSARTAHARLLVDAVSSFGAEGIEFDAWNIDACAATANKCLHGVPGTAFVIVRRAALDNAVGNRSVYLNLATYCAAQDVGTTPFTQSVQTFYGLDAALDELLEGGGWQARRRHYQALMHQVRSGFAALGIEPLLNDGETSCVLSSFKLPASIDYTTLHDGLKGRGFIIYGGQGKLAKSIFRIAVMGAIDSADIERLLAAIATVLQ